MIEWDSGGSGSSKQQAASSKQRAASSEQQASSSKATHHHHMITRAQRQTALRSPKVEFLEPFFGSVYFHFPQKFGKIHKNSKNNVKLYPLFCPKNTEEILN